MRLYQLQNTQYKRLEAGFTEWLYTLGYAPSTVYGLPGQLREFLHWLETKDIMEIKQVTANHIHEFYNYLKTRPNMRRGGGLSLSHLNSQIRGLRQFAKYLKQTGQYHLPVKLNYEEEERIRIRTWLTIEEVQALYKATDDTPIGMRDRALLTAFYGCGLRRGEGQNLETSDILFEKKLLYVRKAKNNHERYVPITTEGIKYFEHYLYDARPLLLSENSKTNTFFISERGCPLHQETMYLRIKALQRKSAHPGLMSKSAGPHTLRHSIATHLLQAGMELENIALFLGHRCLDSTQLYTHLINEPQ